MSLARSILKNTFWLGVGEFARLFLAALTAILVARYLGGAGYGKYVFATSFAQLFAVLVDFGFLNFISSELSRHKDRSEDYMNIALTLKIPISLLYLLTVFGSLLLVGKTDAWFLILLAALGVIVENMTFLFFSFFRAKEKMTYEGLLKLLGGIITFALILLALYKKSGPEGFLLAALVSNILIFFWMAWLTAKKIVRYHLLFDRKKWGVFLSSVSPFVLSMSFIGIYTYVDQVILNLWKGDEVTGWYGAAFRIFFLFFTVAGVYSQAIFPVMARLFEESKEKLQLLLRTSLRFLAIIFFPVAVFVAFYSASIMTLLFEEEFVGGARALQILMMKMVLVTISMVYGNLLLAVAGRKIYTTGVAMGAVLNIALDLFLIPRFSLEGAALGAVLTDIAFLIYMYVAFHKKVFRLGFFREIIRPLIASTLLWVSLSWLNGQVWNIFFQIFIAGIFYTIVLLFLRTFKREDIVFIKTLLRKTS